MSSAAGRAPNPGHPLIWSGEWFLVAAVGVGLVLGTVALPEILIATTPEVTLWRLAQTAAGSLAAGATGLALGPIGWAAQNGTARWRPLWFALGVPFAGVVTAGGLFGWWLAGLGAPAPMFGLSAVGFALLSACSVELLWATVVYGALRRRGAAAPWRGIAVGVVLAVLGPLGTVGAGFVWLFGIVLLSTYNTPQPRFHLEPCDPPVQGACPEGCFQECVPSCEICADCLPGNGCFRTVDDAL